MPTLKEVEIPVEDGWEQGESKSGELKFKYVKRLTPTISTKTGPYKSNGCFYAQSEPQRTVTFPESLVTPLSKFPLSMRHGNHRSCPDEPQ